MKLFYKISIDRVNANYISGWCFHRIKKQRPVRLQCRFGAKVIGEATADLLREDLRELGIHPSGLCGFEMILDQVDEDQEFGNFIEICCNNVKQTLIEIDTRDYVVKKRKKGIDWLERLLPGRKKSNPCIVFMHIPKTAGTTFNTTVGCFWPPKRIISHIELLDREGYAELPKRFRYISGHLRVGVLKQYFQGDRNDFYTIVREPYAQLHSHLKWLMETAGSDRDNFFKYDNPVIHELGTYLAKQDFGSREAIERFIGDMSPVATAFLDNMQTRYFLDYEPRAVGGAELDQALANTGHFKLIGLTEHFSGFVETFAELNNLGAQIPVDRKLNISKASPLFDINDDEMRKTLYPLVQYDLQLYENIVINSKKRGLVKNSAC